MDRLRFVLGASCLMEYLTAIPNVKFETETYYRKRLSFSFLFPSSVIDLQQENNVLLYPLRYAGLAHRRISTIN